MTRLRIRGFDCNARDRGWFRRGIGECHLVSIADGRVAGHRMTANSRGLNLPCLLVPTTADWWSSRIVDAKIFGPAVAMPHELTKRYGIL